jgi:hypothetical protein
MEVNTSCKQAQLRAFTGIAFDAQPGKIKKALLQCARVPNNAKKDI